MLPELEARILARWPGRFHLSTTDESPAFQFAIGDGWYELLINTLESIEPQVRDCPPGQFRILEIKEQFGRLRIVAIGAGPSVYERFIQAAEDSAKVCALCGAPGEPIGESVPICEACRRR